MSDSTRGKAVTKRSSPAAPRCRRRLAIAHGYEDASCATSCGSRVTRRSICYVNDISSQYVVISGR